MHHHFSHLVITHLRASLLSLADFALPRTRKSDSQNRGMNTATLLSTVLLMLCITVTPLKVQASEDITLSLENADITELVRWASNLTDKNIILHPSVNGRVTVIAGDPMTEKQAYDVFLSVLQINNLAVVEESGSLMVVPIAMAKQSGLPVRSDAQKHVVDGEMAVQVVQVKNISATHAINILRPLMPPNSYLSAFPQTNTILLADRGSNLKKILGIIQKIDRADSIEIELVPIEYANARDIVEMLKKLLTNKKKAGRQNLASPFNLVADERSNSIIMTGDVVSRQQVRGLVKRLDKPLQGEGNTRVFHIEYATAADLVPLLESVGGVVKKDAKEKRTSDGEVSIQAHEQVNALVISAPPTIMSTMNEVIKQLDVPRSQVLVEALIVEVNDDLAHNIGIEWKTNGANAGEGVVGGFQSFPAGVSPLGIDATNGALSLGSGLSLGYFKGNNLRGIINLLGSETNANILSTPTIVSLDNEEAEILVGSNVPFITGTEKSDNNANTRPFQTIQRQDIGITLKVKPRINNNDSVTLDINQTVESIAPAVTNASDITTNKREIKTRVLIDNDEILVLGGLMRDELTNKETKVPLLGDLPVLGGLFRSKNTAITKSNLMVFIHPRILHDFKTQQQLSEGKYNMMRNRQIDFDQKVDRFWIPGSGPELPVLPELKNGQAYLSNGTISAKSSAPSKIIAPSSVSNAAKKMSKKVVEETQKKNYLEESDW